MKELWVKKTIYRRYLIDDNEVNEVETILSANTEKVIDIVRDCYDKNQRIEYDDEEPILPLEFHFSRLKI